jgi:hypothetical protein
MLRRILYENNKENREFHWFTAHKHAKSKTFNPDQVNIGFLTAKLV